MRAYCRPPQNVIDEVVAGEYNVYAMPYQYVNWGLVQLGKEPTVYVGDNVQIGMIVDFHKACVEWSLLDE